MTTSTRPASLMSRMRSLFKGVFSLWLRDRELESPEAVYEQAIKGRMRQYRELKGAVAGILYMRGKLEAEILERRADIARLHDEIRRALSRGDEEGCISMISTKQALFEDLERSEKELDSVRIQAEESKANLVRFREEIRSLVREKGRMLATLANAKARRRLQQAVEGLSVDAEMEALEGVREQIARLSAEGDLDRELGEPAVRDRMHDFRQRARRESARSEFEELKKEMASRTIIPAMSLNDPAPVPA